MNPDTTEPEQSTEPRWYEVSVRAAEGMEFGVLSDADGKLVLSVRPDGGEWPDGVVPSSWNRIMPGFRFFVVLNLVDDPPTSPEAKS